jgi:hypothetical protein
LPTQEMILQIFLNSTQSKARSRNKKRKLLKNPRNRDSRFENHTTGKKAEYYWASKRNQTAPAAMGMVNLLKITPENTPLPK